MAGPGVDVARFTVERPVPVQGAVNNGEQLPALFIYLINQFSKMVIKQLISEGWVNISIVDAIGVATVQIFSRPEFTWRGQSLIDILIAKFRITCPVLFGIRGSESTEEGRRRLGWTRVDGTYVSDQQHRSAMTGLAAGYSAITLRDFSRAKVGSPWHPSHFWQTLSCIVSTPPKQASPTQYVVARGLLDGFEGPFLKFYGQAAVEAMTVVCINFTQQADAPDSVVQRQSAAVGGLEGLADKMYKERGIRLGPNSI